MKTIQFCGGSYCANIEPDSYLSLLASKLNAKIIGVGEPGFGHERAFKSFNPSADYTVFIWTDPHVIYHSKFGLNIASCNEKKDKSEIHKAGYLFFKYLHDSDYFEERQIRDLYWFDNEILSKSNSKIIHLFSVKINYQFKNGYNVDQFFLLDYYKDLPDQKIILNHMSLTHNKRLAYFLHENFSNWR